MRRIVINNQKGGVGKTSMTVNVGAELARRGYHVLLIDTDGQSNVAKHLDLNTRPGLPEIILDNAEVSSVIQHARDHLDIIPSYNPRMARVDLHISSQMGREQEDVFVRALQPVQEMGYDFVLLDTATTWGHRTMNCLMYGTDLAIPLNMDYFSVDGLAEFRTMVQGIQNYNPGLALRWIVPTFVDQRLKFDPIISDKLRGAYPKLITSPIRVNVNIKYAAMEGQTIFEYAPHSRGAEDYTRLTDQILERLDG